MSQVVTEAKRDMGAFVVVAFGVVVSSEGGGDVAGAEWESRQNANAMIGPTPTPRKLVPVMTW